MEDRSGWETFWDGLKISWKLLGDSRSEYAKLSAWLVGFEVFNFIPPILLKIIFDELYNARQDSSVGYVVFLVIFGLALQTIVLYFSTLDRDIRFIKITSQVERKLPYNAYEKLLSLTLGYHENENTGEKISKISRGCGSVASSLYVVYYQGLPQLLYVLINIPIIVYLDCRLGLIFLIPFVPLIVISLVMVNRFNPVWYDVEKKNRKILGKASGSMLNIFTVQSCHKEEEELSVFANLQNEVRDIESDALCQMQKYHFAIDVLTKSFISLTLIYGFYFVIKGEIQAGTVVYILNTGGMTLYYVTNLFRQYAKLSRSLVPVVELKKVLDEDPEIKYDPNSEWPQSLKGDLVFKDVLYSYGKNGCSTVRGLDLRFDFSKTYALVARTGAGKTTVFKLLARMMDPDAGLILIDGMDIKVLDLYNYRRLFAVVQQDSPIFNDTVAANVKYYDQAAPDALVEKALRLAQADFVLDDSGKFPKGIHEEIKEIGVNISGGERQRIVIARAFLALMRGAIFLVLDEGTANLDSVTESNVLKSIEILKKEKAFTTIIVSHRLSIINKADWIYVLDDGRVIEEGTDEYLTARDGFYSRLKEAQGFGDLFL